MCGQCKEIDAKIKHYQRVAEAITDQNTIAGIRRGYLVKDCDLSYATEILISPSPSIPPVITSPRCTGPTPSGVPVMMISPGFNAIE